MASAMGGESAPIWVTKLAGSFGHTPGPTATARHSAHGPTATQKYETRLPGLDGRKHPAMVRMMDSAENGRLRDWWWDLGV